MGWVNAHNGTRNLSAVLLHASPTPPDPARTTGRGGGWRTASRYRAACGRLVRSVTGQRWNPAGPGRHCPACVKRAPR